MSARTPASVTQRLLVTMVTGSLVAAQAALVLALVVGWWWWGSAGLASAALGGGLVVLFFSAGQGVQVLVGELDPRLGLGLTLFSYLARVALLGGGLALASRSDDLDQLFRPGPFLVGVATVLIAWIGGMFWAHARSRVPVYDHLADPGSERP